MSSLIRASLETRSGDRGREGRLLSLPAVTGLPERYRLRAPASGREAVITVDGNVPNPDEVGYYDHVTGERMEVVAKLVPLSGSQSNLLRTPENLRMCPHCEQLVGR